MALPTIAFLTDFGTRDHYVGAMKGAALSVCPDATLVDITHDIAPHDILGGAVALAAAFKYFPAGTIFVAVVDPGVGTKRRGLAASANDYRFVAPDNGLLTLAFQEAPPEIVVELTNPQYARAEISRTFEGRDRFAPAGAWLACGTALEALGPSVDRWHVLDVPVPNPADGALHGQVLVVDRFGNLITNIDRPTFDAFASTGAAMVALGGYRARVAQTYADAGHGEICALFGSSDRLEIAVNGGSAAEQLGAARGARVVVTRA
jgi:S-adenosyl-L-methionine hydrolase (adenosine-forming)